ncbi:MAG: hypothetical protein IPP73_04165 [Chitinophagaceae bacterium]|nr:hypothetical protein [Chitinophagaceae bacterium]
MKFVITPLVAILILASCNSTKKSPKPPDSEIIEFYSSAARGKYYACGDSVHTRPLDTFSVVISQSAGMGEHYEFDSAATSIRLVSKGLKDKPKPGDEHMVGGFANIEYKFVSGKPGEETVKFAYIYRGEADNTKDCKLKVVSAFN